MHPYSTDSEERAHLPLYIAGLSIVLAYLVFLLVTHCAGNNRLPFWVEIPGTGAMYAALYTLFQHRCWRWKVFHRFCIVRVPDLQGEWKGFVSSSFDKNAATHRVTVKITQNWTHILMTLSSSVSDSKSLVAALETRSGVVLSYQYLNMPKPHAGETLHAHRGTAVLTLSEDGTKLSGEYYSSRDRQNFGALELKRV